MTRVIGGVARGRAIKTPPGGGIRPTSDRVREALFSSLESALGTLHGRSLLDMYAGSGAVGIEAASRGATAVLCVERDRSVSAGIAANARSLALGQVEVVTAAAAPFARSPALRSFDVAFLDPPYDASDGDVAAVAESLGANGWLAPDGVVVVERSRRSNWTWPAGIEPLRDRRYGDTRLWYGRWEPTRRPDEES